MSPRTAVLEVLRDRSTAARSWWSCTNLARRVRLPPDEVRRALLELVEHGAVERTVLDESGRLREVWRAKGPAGRPAHGRGEDDGVGESGQPSRAGAPQAPEAPQSHARLMREHPRFFLARNTEQAGGSRWVRSHRGARGDSLLAAGGA
jgi:hypothetical protein